MNYWPYVTPKKTIRKAIAASLADMEKGLFMNLDISKGLSISGEEYERYGKYVPGDVLVGRDLPGENKYYFKEAMEQAKHPRACFWCAMGLLAKHSETEEIMRDLTELVYFGLPHHTMDRLWVIQQPERAQTIEWYSDTRVQSKTQRVFRGVLERLSSPSSFESLSSSTCRTLALSETANDEKLRKSI